jgi:hypothetical protein
MGDTKARFQAEGKEPVRRDRLKRKVRNGVKRSAQHFRIDVGMGSDFEYLSGSLSSM